MNVEEILEMWKKDSKIDEVDLDLTSSETPKLHSKYLELYTISKLKLKRLRLKISELKKDKWLWQYYVKHTRSL